MGKEMSFNTQLGNNWELETTEEIDEPAMFKVILYNDDFTTKEFVVEILVIIFHKSEAEANNLMETVHKKGSAVVGVYTYDIACTRAQMTMNSARVNGFPLRCEVVQE